jgi:hypothetical protein
MSEDASSLYRCRDDGNLECAVTCVSLESCLECQCAYAQYESTPGGEVVAVLLCLFPIVFLVVATVKKNPLPSTLSLPMAALLLFLIRTMYLGSDPLLSCGAVILGILDALTPLSIMAGAITLFESMEISYCLPYMMREMKALTSGHVIAECMLIFNFAYMVGETKSIVQSLADWQFNHRFCCFIYFSRWKVLRGLVLRPHWELPCSFHRATIH